MHDIVVLRVVAKFIIPYILVFAFYIQLHGEYSPGGGFQAGVIAASAFVLYCLIWGMKKLERVVTIEALTFMAALGVVIYAGVGVMTMILGRPFLDYDVLSANPVSGQKLGILLVELGVGLSVFAVILLFFMVFSNVKSTLDKK